MKSDMPIKSIAPYYGGKRASAKQIVAEFGEHKGYYNPFAGSLAIEFAKTPVSHEIVNDLNRDITNLMCVLQDEDAAAVLYGKLARTVMCDDIYQDAVYQLGSPYLNTHNKAYYYFIASWMGRNGFSGTVDEFKGMAVRYSPNGGSSATRFKNAIASIPAWHRRLQDLQITNKCGFEMIDAIKDVKESVIYIDPPYLKKRSQYIHDFTDDDHLRLAESLKRFKRARVVVSYYDDERLDDLYPGWTKRHLDATKNMANQHKTASKKVAAPEVLLINGVSYAKEMK